LLFNIGFLNFTIVKTVEILT